MCKLILEFPQLKYHGSLDYPPESKGIPQGQGLVIVNNISQATMLYVTARFQISHPIAPCCDHSSSIGDYCTHKVSKTSSN